MRSPRVLGVMLVFGLGFGVVGDAYAIERCAIVCKGHKDSCSFPCYLPGPFVTTCGEVGPCTNYPFAAPTAVELLLDAPIVDLCEPEVPDVRELAAAWLRSSLELASNFATSLGAVLG